MSTKDWKKTLSLGGVSASLGANASLGTAEAAAMREQLARRKAAREAEEHPAPRPAGAYDELQTAALLSLDARLRQLEASASGMDLLLQDSGGGGGLVNHPFKILKVDATHVRVLYGSVNGKAATNSGSGSSLTISAQAEVWVKVTWNTSTNAVTAAAVESGAAVPNNTESVSYYGLGTVYVESGAVLEDIGQGVTHSLSAERFRCGSAAAQYYYAGV